MHAPANTMTIPDIRLPLQFIVTGLFLFVIAQGMLLTSADALAAGLAQTPAILASAHLLILGFGVMVALGAMYQLIPVALQTNIYSTRLGHVQYVVYTIGTLGLGWSFFDFNVMRLVLFAALTVLAVVLFEWNLWLSIKGVKRSPIRAAVQWALVYLMLTVGIGLWMAIDMLSPHLGAWHDRLLSIHILFGLVGWFTLLIIGISYKLVPMFSLAHGHESRLEMDAVHSTNAGTIVLAAGFLTSWTVFLWIGAIGIFFGFILFGLQLRRILRRRMKKKLDFGLQIAIFAWSYTLILIAASVVCSFLIAGAAAVIPLVYIVITGWVTLTILGYMQKIVPFLWWTHRYSKVIGAANVPMLKDMVSEKVSRWIFVVWVAAMTAVTLALPFGAAAFLWWAQLVLLLASVAYAVTVLNVFTK